MSAVTLEHAGHATVLTINRPEARNAISQPVMTELAKAIEEVGASETRVLALRGAGDRVFVSGGDLKELASVRTHAQAREMALAMRDVCDKLANLPIPVLAGINGHAFGGGCELALACDFRLAVTTARLAFNQVDLAITPAWGGIERLQALLGRARALYLLTTGTPIEASQAWQWGLVEETAEPEEFDTRLDELTQRIARVPREALTGIKATATRAQPAVRPELADAAASAFANAWISDEHWTAVEQACQRRSHSRQS
jgi:enoyl-CoA hydratase/carnithine racemase